MKQWLKLRYMGGGASEWFEVAGFQAEGVWFVYRTLGGLVRYLSPLAIEVVEHRQGYDEPED